MVADPNQLLSEITPREEIEKGIWRILETVDNGLAVFQLAGAHQRRNFDLSHALLPLLDARAVLYQTYRELDRPIKRAASRDELCLRFMAIPG